MLTQPVLLMALILGAADEGTTAKNIVGVWSAEIVEDGSKGELIVEFTAAGQFRFEIKLEGKSVRKQEWPYKIEKDKLITAEKFPNGPVFDNVHDIKKLTRDTLVLVSYPVVVTPDKVITLDKKRPEETKFKKK